MGASNSKLEEDKALQLCCERKKFVRQALDGRCSLAAAHVSYIQSLRSTGTALRKFVQPEGPVDSSVYTSTSATPEPLALTDKSFSQFSFSSPSASQRVDATGHLSPSPSPPTYGHYQTNHMKFVGSFIRKVEEKPPTAVIGTVTSSSTPQNTTPHAHERAEMSPINTSSLPSENPPWDYFGFYQTIDHQFLSHEQREAFHGVDDYDNVNRIREDEGIPELEDEDDRASSNGRETSQETEDEFDEPSSDTLVRSFENFNRRMRHGAASSSPTILTVGSGTPEKELLNGKKFISPKLSPLRAKSTEASPTILTAGSGTPEKELLNGKKINSSKLSPLRAKSMEAAVTADAKITPIKEDDIELNVTPKDFFLSMRDVENLFVKASESGKEVPRMLEANKLHFRPILPGKNGGSMVSAMLKACFSCGKDPSQLQEDPAQTTIKYLTWHQNASSYSTSSMNPLGSNSRDDVEDLTSPFFENFCMISGSHASTLDRLHAWEKKLYDEVKASQIVRRDYDMKCKLLRQQESRGESSHKIDKTRANIKHLHSRIRVAIHRIDSISKRIEELRDKELQPQLEELIEGLYRMWEMMSESHMLQLHIITIAYSNDNAKIPMHSESHRQITTLLENELSTLSSSFTKWVFAQKSYVLAINNWLLKCVVVNEKSSRRKSRMPPPPLRISGPPIYTTCGVWLDKLEALPAKDVADAIKGLAAETSRFLPHQEKTGRKKTAVKGANPALGILNGEAFEDWNTGYDHFRSSLVIFLNRLSTFSESSVKMYGELQKAIQEAKRNYQHLMSQP
ncbi:hypothetical protein Nepgr_008970 [Nepenthes gracilis]|uniref:Uncharacterized protein n=1 Tax=Nepenthes gracilis TaxID=150966 RepID=A0AAD3S9P6_NEPGR|nr:hypothetical protein Nepgr_008970 [Nepenthes gracilis]